MNVLFVHSSSELYGSDRSLLNIVNKINKEKFKVFVLLPYNGPLVTEMRRIPEVQIDIFEVAILRRKNLSFGGIIHYFNEFINSICYLKAYIKKYNIDLVYTNTAVIFPGAIAAKICKKKSVWHIREIIKNNIENRIVSFMMQKCADCIIANSKATGIALAVDSKKIHIVYNAVESRIANKQIKHQQLTIGMAGRINRWKGQKLFVDMAEIVSKNHPDVLFKIAGEAYMGEEYLKEELKSYIKHKGLQNKISLLGQVNNMSNFYQGLDIFVLPSIQPEPFGLVVLEAMEYKLPVVATNHGGPTEIICNGIDGFLVDFNNAEEMAERVEQLIENENLRVQLGNAGFKKKREKFSVSTMVNNIEAVLSNV